MKKYIYKGIEYLSEQKVRQAIWDSEQKVFQKLNTHEEWNKFGVIVKEDVTKELSVDEHKEAKINLVKVKFLRWREQDATLVSSLGFKANSDERANSDVAGLLIAYEDNRDSLITFRDADNEFHDLTYQQLKTLQKEIVVNGNFAYQQKWEFEHLIENCSSLEDILKLNIEYQGKDFSLGS